MTALLFGGGMLAVAIWGVRLCRAFAKSALPSTPGPGDPQFGALIFVVSYALFFAPIAWLGAWLCWSTLNKITEGSLRGAIQELVEQGRNWFTGEERHSLEPLDEQTAKRLGSLGANAAGVLGIITGVLLVALGSLGLIATLVESYRPQPSIYYGRGSVAARFWTYFAVGCVLAIIAGAVILRDILKKADHRWLLPLKIFTALVSARVASDEARRRSKALPGAWQKDPVRSQSKTDSGPRQGQAPR
jgi:hypothetical protein